MAAFTGDRLFTITDKERNQSTQYTSNMSQNNQRYLDNYRCIQKYNTYPSFTPVIYSLSINESMQGVYTVVYVTGSNFQFGNGSTYVNFGTYTRLPISFYNSSYISFVVPEDAPVGVYEVVVVSIYNGNFSPQVNNYYPGVLNYSNTVNYTLT
jgi:hypothetical protein